MFRPKGPAIAGLFFVLVLPGGLTADAKISPSGQQYFRSFLETFTPLVLRREKKGSNDGQGGGNSRQEPGNARWGGKNRDCAGLVRYLFWEAFQPHAGRFLDSYPELQRIPQVDLHEFRAVATQWSEANFTAPQLIAHSRFLHRTAARHICHSYDCFPAARNRSLDP